MDAQQFIAVLAEKDLLSASQVEALRKRIAQSGDPISGATVADWLIEEGLLTPALADRLLGAPPVAKVQPKVQPKAQPEVQPKAQPKAKSKPVDRRPPEQAAPRDVSADKLTLEPVEADELGLAPLESKPAERRPAMPKSRPKTPPPPPPPPPPRPPPPASPPSAARPAAKGVGKPPKTAATPGGEDTDSLLDDELAPLEGGAAVGGGPLDDLMAETALDGSLSAEGSPLAPAGRKRGRLRKLVSPSRKKKAPEDASVWDSSLLLIGGGTLLVLIVLGTVLVWSLTRESGNDLLNLADEEYRAGSYTQAIHKYENYLRKFPNHDGAGGARIRRELARLRQASEGTSNFSKALEIAKEVLATIAPEEEFRETAGAELASLLPDIAEGLAAQARQNPDPDLLAKATEALELVGKYVPRSLQPSGRLEDVSASLALTNHLIDRGKELKTAVAAMRKVIKKADSAEGYSEAYRIRKALLKKYSDVADDKLLEEAVLALSEAEKKAVRDVRKQQSPSVEEPPTAIRARLGLARRTTTGSVPAGEGQVFLAGAEGAVWGLDVATGEVLWQRSAGYATNGQSVAFPPLPVLEKDGGQGVIVDVRRNEVVSVEAATGKLRWRFALNERFDAQPVLSSGRIIVATRSGKLVTIDAASGSSPGYIQLPQQLRVAPTIDSEGSRMYQVADHSNLFVLSLEDHRCERVMHLGHEPGCIATGPVVLSRLLLVAENDRAEDSVLRVFQLGQEQPSAKAVQRIRLKGHVDTPPLVGGRRVLVATDRGAVYVFEIGGADAKTPLQEMARSTTGGGENLIRFPLLESGQFWIADNRLTKYEIQASRSHLMPKWVTDQRSAFLQPLTCVGQTIIHVRRKLGMPGVLVSAVEMDEGKPLWVTHLAAPLATEPMVDDSSGTITAVTSAGGLFQVKADRLKGRAVTDQPTLAMTEGEFLRPIADVIRLDGGVLGMAGGEGPQQVLIFDPRQEPPRFIPLILPGDELACRPTAFRGGLLVPSSAGRVFLLDLRSRPLAEPFQPRLEAGVRLAWRRPVVINEKEVVVADGRTGLYRLTVKDKPKPHLAALANVQMTEPITSGLAVLNNVVYAVDAAGVLVGFELPKLSRVKDRALGGKCVWGPHVLGDRLLLATDDLALHCVDAAGKPLWRQPLPYGLPLGVPLEVDGNYLLAAAGGVVWRVEGQSGRELGKVETNLLLSTGPVLLEGRLLIGSHDGSLCVVEKP